MSMNIINKTHYDNFIGVKQGVLTLESITHKTKYVNWFPTDYIIAKFSVENDTAKNLKIPTNIVVKFTGEGFFAGKKLSENISVTSELGLLSYTNLLSSLHLFTTKISSLILLNLKYKTALN